ncbi:hypothetical protein [Sinorhizobium fredii]|uniref:hypothetical protein n=1 Tax=Rhizobium fredii TaxID=380 RepID=UPI00056BF218|nr:hypothetical protein [Sinorhizobium fredii]
MVEINSSFIGKFKLGDNINFNIDALNALYVARDLSTNGTHKRALCKPICVTITSIIEALLYDLLYRAKWFTKEGVTNMVERVLTKLRSGGHSKLKDYIDAARKHDLLKCNPDPSFYQTLDDLRLVRNRLHIQNDPPTLEADEYLVFTPARVIEAERALEGVMRRMEKLYARPAHAGHVRNFVLPWAPHLDANTPG